MRAFLNLPIRWQLFIIVFIVALPTFGALVYTLEMERNSARERAINDAQKLSASIASEQQNLMSGIHQILTVLTQLPELKSQNSLKLTPILADILRLNPQFTNISVTDQNGTVWASAVPLSTPASQSKKRFFNNAVSSGRFSSGEFTIGTITKKQSFHFSLPFRDDYGEIKGVIGCGIDVSGFKKILDRSKLPKNSNFTIIDHRGIIITRAREPEKFTGKPDDPENFRIMCNGADEGWFFNYARSFDGVKKYSYYYKLRLAGETDPYMYVRAGVPVGEAISAAVMPIIKTLSVLCLALITACTLAYYISKKSILERVEQLKTAARHIGIGNLTIRFSDTVTGGELGELAQAFDDTVLKLAETERERDAKEFMLHEQNRQLEDEMAERQKTFEQLEVQKVRLEREILERKALAGELQGSKQLLADIIDFLPDATFVIDNGKKVIAWNRAVEQLTGVRKDDCIGKGNEVYSCAFHGVQRKILIDLIDEDPETVNTNYSNIHKNDSILSAESFSLHLNGGKGVYLWAAVSPLYDSDGNRVGTIEIVRDITEQKLLANTLEEQQERYRLFASLTSDYVYQCSRQEGSPYRILWMGGAVESVTGYTEEEIYSKGCWLSLAHQDDRERISAFLLSLVPGDTRAEEFRLVHKAGDIKWIREHCFCKEGTIPGELILLGASSDITTQKIAEEDRLNLERQLLHTQKLESLGVLTGGIAHDFNNLLTAILGNLELGLTRVGSDTPVFKNIEKAIQAGKRAADLTQQMLAYAGKGLFQLKSVNLGQLVQENIDFFRTIISKRINLVVEATCDIPLVTADPGQVQQVIMNLITNASEAIGETTGTIRLKTGEKDCDETFLKQSLLDEKPLPGHYAYIEVTDSGCGMDSETRNRIFEPFYTTKFAGRGLGMSAVLGIIKSHHGAILLESSPGKGSIFRIYFPIHTEISVKKKKFAAADTIEPKQFPSSGTVLVVDDEPEVCDICIEYVRHFGFTALSASDGLEAVELFQSHSDEISLVILDLAMPNMDGAATFKELKRIRPDIKVIISSGDSTSYSRLHFHDLIPEAFIQKPFSLPDLEAKVHKVLTT